MNGQLNYLGRPDTLADIKRFYNDENTGRFKLHVHSQAQEIYIQTFISCKRRIMDLKETGWKGVN
jgi:hypothetical protein